MQTHALQALRRVGHPQVVSRDVSGDAYLVEVWVAAGGH